MVYLSETHELNHIDLYPCVFQILISRPIGLVYRIQDREDCSYDEIAHAFNDSAGCFTVLRKW